MSVPLTAGNNEVTSPSPEYSLQGSGRASAVPEAIRDMANKVLASGAIFSGIRAQNMTTDPLQNAKMGRSDLVLVGTFGLLGSVSSQRPDLATLQSYHVSEWDGEIFFFLHISPLSICTSLSRHHTQYMLSPPFRIIQAEAIWKHLVIKTSVSFRPSTSVHLEECWW